MTDAATIARRLTSAQKRALNDMFDYTGLAWDGQSMHGSTLRMLWRLRFIGVEWSHGVRVVRLTPIGMAVRAELERMEAGDA